MRVRQVSLTVVPGSLILYLGFSAGGFFPGTTGIAASALALVLVLQLTLLERRTSSLGPLLSLAVTAVAALAVWSLISVAWSDAPWRAIVEFDRALLYGLALLVVGAATNSRSEVCWVLAGITAGLTILAFAGLVSRVAPDILPTGGGIAQERLSYPLTYWNAVGLVSALATLFLVHYASSTRLPAVVRVGAAALVPAVVTALMFTFSRGSIAAGALALVIYLVVAHPRGAAGALLAVIPATIVAVTAGYRADLLTSEHRTTDAAASQGHEVAVVLALCVLGAGVLRALLLPLDDRLMHLATPSRRMRRALAAGVATFTACALVAGSAAGGMAAVERQYAGFVEGDQVGRRGEDPRGRLLKPGNNGRIDQWRIAIDGFKQNPLTGSGAGTYRLAWERDRPYASQVNDAHSLYLEVASELGLVGLALLAVTLAAIVLALVRRVREAGDERGDWAVLLACAVLWALHAGIDWDWEMPATTLWVFAAGGVATAAPGAGRWPRRRITRVALAVLTLAIAATPALAAVSQSRLDAGVEAFERRECRTAIDAALSSLAAVPARAEPFELLAYCDARLGLRTLSIRSMRSAIDRDPLNWELHYGLAVVRGAAGLDPRPALRRARELNPREPLLKQAVAQFDTERGAEWRKAARDADLPIR